MPNPVIFVPYSKAGKSGPFSLYTVICRENPASSYWNIREDDPLQNTDVLHKDIDNKVYNLQKYFKDEKGREFELALRQDGKSLACLTDSTPSVFLGLFICALVEIEKRRYCDTWESVTITGDVEIKDSDISLKPVGSIGEKYAGFSQEIQAYRENHPGKHLFLYVSDTTSPLEPCDGVEIKDFSSADSLETVLEFLFSDKEQDRLFDCVDSSLKNWDYVQTDVFKQCKQEALLKNWKGFFIHGEGESGKSALAYALAKDLKRDGCIYAPIWVSMDEYFKNIDLSMASPVIDDKSNPLEKRNILIDNPISGYIASQISERLQMDGWTREQGVKPLRRAMGKRRYLLVIDNLELDKADLVLDAVYDIISYCDSKPVILTSRYGWKNARAYQRLGLKSIEVPVFTLDEVTALVRNIAAGRSYEQKLRSSEETEEYRTFMEQLYRHFKSYPGIITVTVPLLERKTISELIPDLVNLGQAKDIYKNIFEQLDECTKAVLFAFIGTMGSRNGDSVKQNIARRLQASGWTLNGAVPEDWELEEEIPKSLDTLVRNHILNRTGEQKDGYAINSVPLVFFVFGDFGHKWNALRETLIEPDMRIKVGLVYNQKHKLLKPLLERLKEEGKDISSFLFLHYVAIYSKRPEHIKLLLSDIDVSTIDSYINSRDSKWKTPLHYAVENQNKDIITTLISKGADINAGDKDGCTPLHYAVNHTNLDIIKFLIKRKANIHVTDSWGHTLLHYAAGRNQNKEVIDFLIGKGSDINAKNIFGVTPLHRAAGHNQNKEVIDFLIGKGSDINAKNKLGATPLHWAATNENREILETLIKRGCNIHITDSMGNTLLHYAAIKLYNTTNVPMTSFNIFHNLDWDLKSNPANITFLLDKGLDINAKNEEDETPLHCAAMFGNPAILEILIENDGNIHDTDSNRDTLLHYAARCNGNEKVIIFLLDKGLDIKAKNKNGKTPLHWAAKDNPYEKVISTLLDADETKETIHTKDENGKTPLMLAAAYNSSPYVCIILIEAGSRLAEKDNTGKTALEYLRERKDWTDIEPSIW